MRPLICPLSVRLAYLYFLGSTPTFRALPDVDVVHFLVDRSRPFCGWYTKHKWRDSGYTIAISERNVHTTAELLATVAHEMIHLALDVHHQKDTSVHGEKFRRLARRISLYHGFRMEDIGS